MTVTSRRWLNVGRTLARVSVLYLSREKMLSRSFSILILSKRLLRGLGVKGGTAIQNAFRAEQELQRRSVCKSLKEQSAPWHHVVIHTPHTILANGKSLRRSELNVACAVAKRWNEIAGEICIAVRSTTNASCNVRKSGFEMRFFCKTYGGVERRQIWAYIFGPANAATKLKRRV
jgi:hypothetical protein